jgi:hypothetical protein
LPGSKINQFASLLYYEVLKRFQSFRFDIAKFCDKFVRFASILKLFGLNCIISFR